jgi:hypothetical protein
MQRQKAGVIELGNTQFSYRDVNGHLCNVEMKNATTLVVRVAGIEIVISAALGFTPKTYYSGHIPKGRIQFTTPPNIIVKTVVKSGRSNDDAFEKVAETGAQIIFSPFGASCDGICFLSQTVTENEFGLITHTKVIMDYLEVVEIRRATIEEYLRIIVPTGNLRSDKVLFSGWKNPENLVEGDGATYEVCFLNFINYRGSDYRTSIPFAQPIGVNCFETATQAVVLHLDEIYEKS